ncbi:MAG: dockerin type I repeat-containing protein [Ruminococcus sp.]|nr:dockerin type I repeat-containing protein [Ruminococcus sp.]
MKHFFKKTIATILSVATLATAAVIPNASAMYSWTLGDVNDDNYVNETDARLILRYYTEVYVAHKPNHISLPKSRADVNKDGAITIEDAQLILMFEDYAETHYIPKTSWFFAIYLTDHGVLPI